MAVTAVALMYQWADTMRMARGRGIDAPKARHASEDRFRSRAFMGLPWPKNTAGIGVTSTPPVYFVDGRPAPSVTVGGAVPAQGHHSDAPSG